MKTKWEMAEPGWWYLTSDGSPLPVAVCKESDGRWHTYVHRGHPPGDSRHRTLRLAQKAAERTYSEIR